MRLQIHLITIGYYNYRMEDKLIFARKRNLVILLGIFFSFLFSVFSDANAACTPFRNANLPAPFVNPMSSPTPWLNRTSCGFLATGYFSTNEHLGEDIMAAVDTPVRSICNGYISNESRTGWRGNNFDTYINSRVIVQCDATAGKSSFLSIYGHINTQSVNGTQATVQGIGARVRAGDIIGYVRPSYRCSNYVNNVCVGVSARTTSNDHLHFGINTGTRAIGGNGWGFGMAPRGTTAAQAQAHGFTDPITFFQGGLTIIDFWGASDPIYVNGSFDAQYKVRNSFATAKVVDDMAIAVSQNGNFLFDCWRKGTATTITANGIYQTGRRFCSFNRSGTYLLEGKLKVNGVWRTYLQMPVTVRVNSTIQDDHGNTQATATAINSNSTTAGRIEVSGDVDYFRIVVGSTGTLNLNTTGGTDTMGSLFNSAGSLIASNDDGGGIYGLNFRISRVVTAGTYYVKVNAFSTGTGSYSLVSQQAVTWSLTTNANPVAGSQRAPSTQSGIADGTVVTRTAYPAAGYRFSRWTGCDRVTGSVCTVTMRSNRTVTANFTQLDGFPVFSPQPTLPGSVTIPGVLHFSGGAQDDIGISYLNMRVIRPNGTSWLSQNVNQNGVRSVSLSSFTFSSSGQPYNMGAGTYTVQMVATDTSGQSTYSPGIRVVVSAAQPGAPEANVLSRFGDFNGNGLSDMLWHHQLTGKVYIWHMNGNTRIGQAVVGNIKAPWVLERTADFNGDGITDLLLRNTTNGGLVVWILNAQGKRANAGFLGVTSNTGWKLVDVANVDATPNAELIFQRQSDGAMSYWTTNGTKRTGAFWLGRVSNTTWNFQGAADVNGDGKADLVWRNPTTGQVYSWWMNGRQRIGQSILGIMKGTTWNIATFADLNGDGSSDVLWQDASGKMIAWLVSNGKNTLTSWVGALNPAQWQLRGTGDFNGDGKAELFVRNTTTGAMLQWYLNGVGTRSIVQYMGAMTDVNYQER